MKAGNFGTDQERRERGDESAGGGGTQLLAGARSRVSLHSSRHPAKFLIGSSCGRSMAATREAQL